MMLLKHLKSNCSYPLLYLTKRIIYMKPVSLVKKICVDVNVMKIADNGEYMSFKIKNSGGECR